MTTLTNNIELNQFVSEMNPNNTLFAIRTKGKIEVFETKRKFNKVAKTLPNAVQGEFTTNNFVWYRF